MGDEHVKHRIDRAPGGEIEKAGQITFEQCWPRLRKQKQRKHHRKHRVEDDGEHKVQHWNPSHRLPRCRDIGILGLHVGMKGREGISTTRAEIRPGLHEGVHQRALLEDGLCAHRGAAVIGLRHRRQVVLELGNRACSRQVGIEGRRRSVDARGRHRRESLRDGLVCALTAND